MSRTDVHAPAWVKEHDPAWRREMVADHNHTVSEHWDPQLRRHLVRRLVPCDLPKFLAGANGTRCRMRYAGGRNVYCGCNLCTGQAGRRLARRQERVRWRSKRQELLAAGREDLDVVDVPRFRGTAR